MLIGDERFAVLHAESLQHGGCFVGEDDLEREAPFYFTVDPD